MKGTHFPSCDIGEFCKQRKNATSMLLSFYEIYSVEAFFDSLVHNINVMESPTALLLVIVINLYYGKLYGRNII